MVFAIHWHESAMDIHVFPIPIPPPTPSPSHPSGSSQCTSPEHLSHASHLGWWSVSPLIVYLFQCCSLRTSHPRLLPQSPKVCSVHLCLFFRSLRSTASDSSLMGGEALCFAGSVSQLLGVMTLGACGSCHYELTRTSCYWAAASWN